MIAKPSCTVYWRRRVDSSLLMDPVRILSIIFSMQMNSKLANRDFEGAKAAGLDYHRIAFGVFTMNMIFQGSLNFNMLD